MSQFIDNTTLSSSVNGNYINYNINPNLSSNGATTATILLSQMLLQQQPIYWTPVVSRLNQLTESANLQATTNINASDNASVEDNKPTIHIPPLLFKLRPFAWSSIEYCTSQYLHHRLISNNNCQFRDTNDVNHSLLTINNPIQSIKLVDISRGYSCNSDLDDEPLFRLQKLKVENRLNYSAGSPSEFTLFSHLHYNYRNGAIGSLSSVLTKPIELAQYIGEPQSTISSSMVLEPLLYFMPSIKISNNAFIDRKIFNFDAPTSSRFPNIIIIILHPHFEQQAVQLLRWSESVKQQYCHELAQGWHQTEYRHQVLNYHSNQSYGIQQSSRRRSLYTKYGSTRALNKRELWQDFLSVLESYKIHLPKDSMLNSITSSNRMISTNPPNQLFGAVPLTVIENEINKYLPFVMPILQKADCNPDFSSADNTHLIQLQQDLPCARDRYLNLAQNAIHLTWNTDIQEFVFDERTQRGLDLLIGFIQSVYGVHLKPVLHQLLAEESLKEMPMELVNLIMDHAMEPQLHYPTLQTADSSTNTTAISLDSTVNNSSVNSLNNPPSIASNNNNNSSSRNQTSMIHKRLKFS